MIAIVCGGRDYRIAVLVNEVLAREGVTFVIEGGCSGADKLAREWARRNARPCATVLADWDKFGPKAGPIRNGWMLRLNPDVVIAFPGGAGTADMVKQARAAGVRVVEVSE